MFAIKFSNEGLNKDYKNYFKIILVEYSFDQSTQEEGYQEKEMVKCTEEHFKNLKKQDFENNNLSENFCFPLNYSYRTIYETQKIQLPYI